MEFVKGLIVKETKDNAPEWCIATMSMKVEELMEWLAGQEKEWINLKLNRSKKGKLYIAVDDWKPNKRDNYEEDGTPF
ncbi:MAG: hypothetical protein H8E13_13190 [Actinobacteria bacterium]|nr:hypothetical protein [Actinomycetota bacterium]